MIPFEESIFNFLLSYATQPVLVYTAIAILMTAGSFGLPVSEEIVIISAGLMAFIGSHPELYPDIASTTSTVTIPMASIVCFGSVFLSDFLVFLLGRFASNHIHNYPFFSKLIPQKKMQKISKLIDQYGYIYPALFRLIPGLRFPGHFSSGLFRISFFQFTLVDGIAALLTVPTQVILVGIFGETIISHLKEFVFLLSVVVVIFITVIVIRKFKDIRSALQ